VEAEVKVVGVRRDPFGRSYIKVKGELESPHL
jgi:hypothetical protein